MPIIPKCPECARENAYAYTHDTSMCARCVADPEADAEDEYYDEEEDEGNEE